MMPKFNSRQLSMLVRHFAFAFLLVTGLWIALDVILNLDELMISSPSTGRLIANMARFSLTRLTMIYGLPATLAGLYAGYRLSLANRPAQSPA